MNQKLLKKVQILPSSVDGKCDLNFNEQNLIQIQSLNARIVLLLFYFSSKIDLQVLP